jgi:hypothetical protein
VFRNICVLLCAINTPSIKHKARPNIYKIFIVSEPNLFIESFLSDEKNVVNCFKQPQKRVTKQETLHLELASHPGSCDTDFEVETYEKYCHFRMYERT